MDQPVLGLICCAADGLEQLRGHLVEPLLADGVAVAVTATPTAARWLDAYAELTELERVTGYPVRSEPRLPTQPRPHPPAHAYAIVPATANTIAKVALGLADNQALTHACEALGGDVPMVVFPRINTAHAGQPAWHHHIAALRRAGAELIYGDDVWPLLPPGADPERQAPWDIIHATISGVLARAR